MKSLISALPMKYFSHVNILVKSEGIAYKGKNISDMKKKIGD